MIESILFAGDFLSCCAKQYLLSPRIFFGSPFVGCIEINAVAFIVFVFLFFFIIFTGYGVVLISGYCAELKNRYMVVIGE